MYVYIIGVFSHNEVGTINVFGDSQLHVDIESDLIQQS